MTYKLLGKTGIEVSRLCYGTMSFGGDADEETSAVLFKRCLDAGINFFDCANVYSNGTAEKILGRLMAGMRDELVITTKVYGNIGSGEKKPARNDGGLNRRHMVRQVEESLRRLNTDRIDIYFVHQFDDRLPIEEVVMGLEMLVQQGKILYPAVSNWASWQIMKALSISEYRGWARFECIQPMYNLTKRQAEVEILPMAEAEQVGVIPYGPMGGGLLSGKYSTHSRPSSGRLIDNKMYSKRYLEDIYYEVAERFTAFAGERGFNPASLAVAWVMAHPGVTAPIIGARNVQQLEGSLAALDIDMTPELYAEIGELAPTPPPATDRSEQGK
ncbi:MAG: aldo/keto reductase [Chloroflexota bacterium]